ncbi:hypothetical protein MCETHM1_03058 [Flavobacteriaceae bacterium]
MFYKKVRHLFGRGYKKQTLKHQLFKGLLLELCFENTAFKNSPVRNGVRNFIKLGCEH